MKQYSSSTTGARFSAAADFLGNGAVEVPVFESEILDMIRRESVALQRFNHVPANGDPHRYFEQTAIGTAQFDNKRSLSPTPSGPTRVERSAVIKCIDNQTNITLYDKNLTKQQGQFAQVVAKDIEDTASAVVVLSAQSIWDGNDTSLLTPTTNEYVGALTQIGDGGQISTIAPGSSIIDGLKAQVSQMMANQTYKVKPNIIYLNPVLGNALDAEAKAAQITFGKTEVVAGVQVDTLKTQAGELPIITEPYIPSDTTAKYGFDAPPDDYSNYYAVILSEPLIEMPFVYDEIENPHPRIYQLGLVNSLNGQFVAVLFDAIIVKAAAYAHSLVAVQ